MPVRLDGLHDPELAGAVLARAFQAEPLSAWQIPDDAERAVLLPGHFERVVRLAQIAGEVWRSEEYDAVACWLGPGRWPPATEELVEAGMTEVEALIGRDAWSRFEIVYSALDDAHARAIHGDHWDLWVLGVLPEAQGNGVASRLVAPMLERLDRAGEVCYLETLDERTLRLYARLGFEVVIDETEPVSGMRFWCCVRAPQGDGSRRS